MESKAPEPTMQITITVSPEGIIETKSNIKSIQQMIGVMTIATAACTNSLVNPGKEKIGRPENDTE